MWNDSLTLKIFPTPQTITEFPDLLGERPSGNLQFRLSLSA